MWFASQMSGDDSAPGTAVGRWKTEHTFMNIRPAGLSDGEEEEDENLMDAKLIRELQSVYYSDEEDQVDEALKQTKNECDGNKDQRKNGWVYRVSFCSGFTFEFSILTSFLVFCDFRHYDERQSTEMMCKELLTCCEKFGYTAQLQLEYDLFSVGITPGNFLSGLRDALEFTKHELVYISNV